MRSKFILLFCFLSVTIFSQEEVVDPYAGLSFRGIGPAFTSGRIADIAISPKNENHWYVAIGSGGVWKTINAGTTWTPIFDGQSSYSIGCVTLDPQNPNVVWVGTGENVGGRHVGYGDGIYLSRDGGSTWAHQGLKNAEHISKIIVHPENGNIIWVASQGPLWSKGGERGIFKSMDGGNTWKHTLGDEEWVGATDLLIDPNDPNILYAATWQRHRTVAAFLGSGPGSGLHKSVDGGETWVKLTNGIPKVNLGKIGLAMNPFNSSQIYAAIELENLTGGLFVTTDAGASWEKYSDVVSGGTGPHYYQELYASPHVEGRLYLMNNYVKISNDHGRSFANMNENKKHVDSHAMAFKKSDPNYLLFGTDGGLYESFDHTKTWKFIRNLPVTQYYKVAVDDSEPWYKIYGGTQDNGSHGGPSRTANKGGIFNHDWWTTLFADGHQSATEPGNPNISYGEFQEGWLWRIDQITREAVYIQPQARAGEPTERFNWDAPIVVSSHKPSRLYFASQRVWRSDDRGDSWTPISGDLTRNQDRMTLPIMGGYHSVDNAWDLRAMSTYNTISSLAESPLAEGLLYAGTDDGLLHVSEDSGASWRTIELSSIKGIPATAFINDVRADLHEVNTVYVAMDNHKYGDYKPYLIKSTDRGRTWSSINGNIPDRHLVWRIVQDHVKPELLFVGTEFGVFVTHDSGKNWHKLKGGLPTISVRDITIHRKADDLIIATFGRGIYILDDINPIRQSVPTDISEKPTLFNIRTAHLYVPELETYGQGNAEYAAPNPPFGAVLTYFLPDSYKSMKDQRKDKEKGNQNIPFPGWDALDDEKSDQAPRVFFVIKDDKGNIVNTVNGTNKKGFNTISWGLDVADRTSVPLKPMPVEDDYFGFNVVVPPGKYSAQMMLSKAGNITELSPPMSVEVKRLRSGALPEKSPETINIFRDSYFDFMQAYNATSDYLEKTKLTVAAMHVAQDKAVKQDLGLANELSQLRRELELISRQLNGSPTRMQIGEKTLPNPSSGVWIGMVGLASSTYGPTPTHEATLQLAHDQLREISTHLKTINDTKLQDVTKRLKDIGAPYIEGQGLR